MNEIHDLPYWKEQREQREAERKAERLEEFIELYDAAPRHKRIAVFLAFWWAIRVHRLRRWLGLEE